MAIGLGVGFLVRQARRHMENPPAEITMSLLTGFLAYLPAEILNVSAVLAVVTAGVSMGWYAPELTTAETRLQTDAFWRILSFLLNAALFVLTGLRSNGKPRSAASTPPTRPSPGSTSSPARTGCARTPPSACAASTRSGGAASPPASDHGDDGSTESRSRDYQRLRRELLAAEQQAVVDLRRRGVIGDEAMTASSTTSTSSRRGWTSDQEPGPRTVGDPTPAAAVAVVRSGARRRITDGPG